MKRCILVLVASSVAALLTGCIVAPGEVEEPTPTAVVRPDAPADTKPAQDLRAVDDGPSPAGDDPRPVVRVHVQTVIGSGPTPWDPR